MKISQGQSKQIILNITPTEIDEFHDRIKVKSTEVLEKYMTILKPPGFWNAVCYFMDSGTSLRGAIVYSEIQEQKRKAQEEKKKQEKKNLENKIIE